MADSSRTPPNPTERSPPWDTVPELLAGIFSRYPEREALVDGEVRLTYGELAARVAHPRHGVVREYMVKIRGDLTRPEYDKLIAGTSIEGRVVKPRLAQRVKQGRGGATTWWRIEVTEGRTHEVRELFFRAGHHVQRLRRTAIGPLRDDTLKPGEFRTLSEKELQTLRRVTSRATKPGRPRPGGSGKGVPAARKPPARKPSTRER